MRKLKASILRNHTKPDGKLDLLGLVAWPALIVFTLAPLVFLPMMFILNQEMVERNIASTPWLISLLLYVVITFGGLVFLQHHDKQVYGKTPPWSKQPDSRV